MNKNKLVSPPFLLKTGLKTGLSLLRSTGTELTSGVCRGWVTAALPVTEQFWASLSCPWMKY